jgi:hypothetical protein
MSTLLLTVSCCRLLKRVAEKNILLQGTDVATTAAKRKQKAS